MYIELNWVVQQWALTQCSGQWRNSMEKITEAIVKMITLHTVNGLKYAKYAKSEAEIKYLLIIFVNIAPFISNQ